MREISNKTSNLFECACVRRMLATDAQIDSVLMARDFTLRVARKVHVLNSTCEQRMCAR